ncbi:MAG: hypothetical protein D6788_06035 [Planctomycetota bacterium]|nr:MAG: hypothetical protein D6788_06035 [Planctomycetota bacterium]
MRDITHLMERLEAVEKQPLSSGVGDTPEQAVDTGEGKEGRLDAQLHELERREILRALEEAGGQRTLAARLLGISRSRLYRRMDALGIATRDETRL